MKKEGEKFAKGELLLEVETRKAIVQIDAPESGMMVRINAKEGDSVISRSTLALYVVEGEAVPPEFLKPVAPVVLVIRLLNEGELVTDAKVTLDRQELALTKDGEFAINGLAPGRYTVNIKAPGFFEKVFVFALGDGETSRHDLELHSMRNLRG
jgi:pyruvate/2-oxoglutarate dehydrogenase complex dihydrolipoamide acyltransferase (E2) component